ncbi:PAS domain-containing sensor histidine kinase [Niastella populi]|uniref:histidine kinase n=1 Tax=Niastella populi TaxID=550983 RepID=A0A1V9ES04_9BACT|nr:PAS domain-containing sensor histidine kinase [Niastella populi]OQP48929.1 PAS domain-containing sensor histidine kinase [Niastella populi]
MNIDAGHLTSLFEHSTEGIILTNGEGRIVLINPAAQSIFGYSEQEITGRPIETLIPDRARVNHAQLRAGFYEHPQHRVMGHGRDLYGKKKDGNEIPVEVSLSFYKRDGELFVIAFIVDITLRKAIEQNNLMQQKQLEQMAIDMRILNAELETKVKERTMILQEALKELERSQNDLNEALSKEKELSEIKSRFVSMASHEFRTPLSTVLSSAALVSRYNQQGDNEKSEKHIKKIKDAVKHLSDLLEDFLSLGKLEEGKVHAHAEPIDINDFLREIIEEVQVVVKNGQAFDLECHTGGQFYTDRKLLKNILINLLTNAIKFSPEHSSIYLKAVMKDGNLVITVKDNGIGISGEDQQHLFSSFFRGKNATNIQGTGLGLHIVKRYVELIQGYIELQSKLQSGTTVTITLPDLGKE